LEVHIKRDYSVPAAIQFKNPGAMWPGAIATKWGSTKWQYLSDGTGQGGGGHGNKIAIFDTWSDGIAAQIDLWRSSANYKNKRFADAIAIWSGHNNVPSYIALLKKKVPGLTEDTILNDAFWRGPMAIPFLKAQAGHEAGKPIPASDTDWLDGQRRAMGGVTVKGTPTPSPAKKAATDIAAKTGTVTVAIPPAAYLWYHWTWDFPHIAGAVVLLAGLVGFVYWMLPKTERLKNV